jgi:GTP-binding protein EngB required for normal cell division
MSADLVPVLDALDRAVAHAGLLNPDDVQPSAEVARRARDRRGFLGETVVLALAGGTGSGKSSLLNALAGEKVAETGAVRPVTDRPLAWIPFNPEPGLVRLLDELGIEDRMGQDRFPNLAVLDLPDYDSIDRSHRATVEYLLPRVDAVAWVVDPEKYNDAALHDRYLAPLAAYQGQYLVVLNQIDRLEPAELDGVLADLARTLRRDGIREPEVFPIAADPPGGSPRGLEPLRRFLQVRMDAKRVAVGKLLEDLRGAGRSLSEAAGVSGGSGMNYEGRWAATRDRAGRALATMAAGRELARVQERAGERMAVRLGGGLLGKVGALAPRRALGRALGGASLEDAPRRTVRAWAARPGLEEVLAEVTEFATALSFEAGGAFGHKVREEFTPDRIESEVRTTMDRMVAALGPPPEPSAAPWWRVVGALQAALLVAIVVGGVWAWARPESLERGRWPVPLLVIVGGLMATAVLSRLVRWSGRRRGGRAVREFHDRLQERLAEELDERIGRPLRDILRERAVLLAALAELGVEAARVERAVLAER